MKTTATVRTLLGGIAAVAIAVVSLAGSPAKPAAAAPLPDLVISNFYLNQTFACAFHSPLYEFAVTVKNIGGSASSSTLVQVLEDQVTTTAQPAWGNGATVGALQPGQSSVVLIRVYPLQKNFNFPNGKLTYNFRARVDPANLVTETNGGNNSAGPLPVYGYKYCP